jgi:hypothetical protein
MENKEKAPNNGHSAKTTATASRDIPLTQTQRKMGLLKRAYKRRDLPYDGRYGT